MRFQLTDPADPADVARVVDALAGATVRCGSTSIIAIDGLSGSGKTTLARAVSEALGAPTVHMDDLYPGWDGLAEAVGLLTTQVLAPISRGERAAYRVWDWRREEWNGVTEVPVSDRLVVEGCGSSVGAAGTYAAVRVWMEASREVRMRRGLARDGEAYRPHWERWAVQEAEIFARDGTRGRAHVVITTG